MERQQALKQWAVQLKGGKCAICGYKKYIGALEFHHVNPKEKDKIIGKTKSKEKVEKELEKCVLLCSVCHKEVHAGLHPNYIPRFL